MRSVVPGLLSPHPLVEKLPSLYTEDDFTPRLVSALDEVLAPVLCTLDNLERYVQPALAPGDFVDWMAHWVGAALDDNWPDERRRAAVARAAPLHRTRGTSTGLAEQISLLMGSQADVADSGGVTWSQVPGAAYPGQEKPEVVVTVRASDPASVDLQRLDRVVAKAKPAHVSHRVEVVQA